MKNTMEIADRVHHSMAARRADRKRRHTLLVELSGFSSTADRLELDTIIDRYPDEQTTELRQLLHAHDMVLAA